MGSLALATAWIGGFIFAVFWWLASIVVVWEWQRLVGGARLAERVAVGSLMLALAALFALHNSILGVIAALVLGAVAVGWLAGRRDRDLGGRGRVLRRRAGRQRRAVENQSELRLGLDFMAVRSRLGNGYCGLFRWTADRGPSALAERLAWQDLGRGDRGRARRRSSRPHARGVDESSRGAILARACGGDCLRARRPVRIRAQAAFRRQGFERPHSRPWRIDGPARRVCRGVPFRRGICRPQLAWFLHRRRIVSMVRVAAGVRAPWLRSRETLPRQASVDSWARRARSDARARRSLPPRQAGFRSFRLRADATGRRWPNARSSSAPNSPR